MYNTSVYTHIFLYTLCKYVCIYACTRTRAIERGERNREREGENRGEHRRGNAARARARAESLVAAAAAAVSLPPLHSRVYIYIRYCSGFSFRALKDRYLEIIRVPFFGRLARADVYCILDVGQGIEQQLPRSSSSISGRIDFSALFSEPAALSFFRERWYTGRGRRAEFFSER